MTLDTSRLEVSNLELLQGVEDTALAAMQHLVTLDAYQDKQEVAAYINPVKNGIVNLGKVWDDELAGSLRENLDNLNSLILFIKCSAL